MNMLDKTELQTNNFNIFNVFFLIFLQRDIYISYIQVPFTAIST